ncbi:MAG: TIGR01777 family oxidoreductase [Enterobacteriaceae bacterium]
MDQVQQEKSVLLTGATGLIGRHLIRRLLELRYPLTILTRRPAQAHKLFGDQVTYWSSLADKSSLNGFHAVINLAGEPIMDKRWSRKQKAILCHSRWSLTQQLAELICASEEPPAVLISGSAMGYYGNQGQSVVNEDEPPQPGFSHQLCQQWETLAQQAASKQTRVCLCRTGIVLSAEGGALAKMLPAFRLGLGAVLGDGKQYLPWIHIDDMVNGIYYLLSSEDLSGPFNMVAPYPVNNSLFTATLAQAVHRPALLRIPAPMLRLLVGEGAELLLEGQRGLPARLEQAGFGFRFFELRDALSDLLSKPKQ